MTLSWIVQKHDELIVVGATNGDLTGVATADGLYFRDMRHLSTLRIAVDDCPLELLGSGTNAIDRADIHLVNQVAFGGAPPHSITVTRRRQLGDALREQISVTNHNRFPIALTLAITVAADFRDLYDIRDFLPHDPPSLQTPRSSGEAIELAYESPDRTRFATHVSFAPAPDAVEMLTLDGTRPGRPTVGFVANFSLAIAAGMAAEVALTAGPSVQPSDGPLEVPLTIGNGSERESTDWGGDFAEIRTSNARLNDILARALADLRALITPLRGGGRIIAAGIPWYVAPFGRDSLITARQLLPWNSAIAAETLRYLASTQGAVDDPWRDEQPGKIMHEMRFGELARRDLTPFSRYYGTLDATPLFLTLLSDYLDTTGDSALFGELRLNVDRALGWIDTYLHTGAHGFINYSPNHERGLVNQGWKDSHDAVQHADGGDIVAPIALLEAQGYVYAAKSGLSRHFAAAGDHDTAHRLSSEAEALRSAVETHFWMENAGFYSEAFMGDGRPNGAITSNPLHLLASGLPSQERAERTAARLLEPDLFTGWGIRTLATTMPHYNPVSYHCSSVWPHDNAFGLWGFRSYRQLAALDQLATALFDLASRCPIGRLPELVCGYVRGDGADALPIDYPTTCSPQAWAAGVPLVILETLLGLRADAARHELTVDPWLPDWLDWIEVDGLRVGNATVSLRVSGHHDRVDLEIRSDASRKPLMISRTDDSYVANIST